MSEKVESFNKERCVKWLKEIGQSSGGTLEGQRNKIKMYLRYPKLTNKLKAKANMYYRFKCSLDPLEIPIITAKWSSNEMLYPIVNEDIFYRYCNYKKYGSRGQQEKAFRMLQSRKIASVKALIYENFTYVKAMIKKSYGEDFRIKPIKK